MPASPRALRSRDDVQLQVGSSLFFAPQGSATWTEVPLTFAAQVDNNKYYSAAVR